MKEKTQNPPLNIFTGKIETKSVIIRGDPGSGKTLTAWLLCLGYKRIFSNVNFYKNGKKVNETVRYMSDIRNLKFDPIPGILILDEMGVNGNSRKSMSADNIEFGKLGMLQRKFNIYVVWVAQQDFSFDKNQRLTAHLILHCYAIESQTYHSIINVTREKSTRGSTGFLFDAERNMDIIKMMQILHRTYDQLDQSIIIGKKKTKEQKKKKEKEEKIESI